MAAASNYYTVLTAVKAVIDGLSLTLNAAAVPSAVRKLPRAEETIDALPLICVVPPQEPDSYEWNSFEGRNCQYPVEVVIVAAGNRDFTTNLDVYLSWRQAIRDAFKGPLLSGAPTVWRTDVDPELVIDREQVNNDYDYSGLIVRCQSQE